MCVPARRPTTRGRKKAASGLSQPFSLPTRARRPSWQGARMRIGRKARCGKARLHVWRRGGTAVPACAVWCERGTRGMEWMRRRFSCKGRDSRGVQGKETRKDPFPQQKAAHVEHPPTPHTTPEGRGAGCREKKEEEEEKKRSPPSPPLSFSLALTHTGPRPPRGSEEDFFCKALPPQPRP